jgi:hypothetical protein
MLLEASRLVFLFRIPREIPRKYIRDAKGSLRLRGPTFAKSANGNAKVGALRSLPSLRAAGAHHG